jgi:hypothetical protein
MLGIPKVPTKGTGDLFLPYQFLLQYDVQNMVKLSMFLNLDSILLNIFANSKKFHRMG